MTISYRKLAFNEPNPIEIGQYDLVKSEINRLGNSIAPFSKTDLVDILKELYSFQKWRMIWAGIGIILLVIFVPLEEHPSVKGTYWFILTHIGNLLGLYLSISHIIKAIFELDYYWRFWRDRRQYVRRMWQSIHDSKTYNEFFVTFYIRNTVSQK